MPGVMDVPVKPLPQHIGHLTSYETQFTKINSTKPELISFRFWVDLKTYHDLSYFSQSSYIFCLVCKVE